MNKVQDIIQGNGTGNGSAADADNDRRMSRVSTGPMGESHKSPATKKSSR